MKKDTGCFWCLFGLIDVDLVVVPKAFSGHQHDVVFGEFRFCRIGPFTVA